MLIFISSKTHLLNTPVIRSVSLQIQKKREDLRLIVTSATLNAEVWTTYMYSAYISFFAFVYCDGSIFVDFKGSRGTHKFTSTY